MNSLTFLIRSLVVFPLSFYVVSTENPISHIQYTT